MRRTPRRCVAGVASQWWRSGGSNRATTSLWPPPTTPGRSKGRPLNTAHSRRGNTPTQQSPFINHPNVGPFSSQCRWALHTPPSLRRVDLRLHHRQTRDPGCMEWHLLGSLEVCSLFSSISGRGCLRLNRVTNAAFWRNDYLGQPPPPYAA